MKPILFYFISFNLVFFIIFFHYAKVSALIDFLIDEVKNTFDFIMKKKEANKLLSLTFYHQDKDKKDDFLKLFYISRKQINKLSQHSNMHIHYRTYIAFCTISSLLFGLSFYIIFTFSENQTFFDLSLVFLSFPIGFYGPYFFLKNRAYDRIAKIDKDLPNFIDLMLICLDSGFTLEQSLKLVAKEFKEINPTLAKEFDKTYCELTLFLDQKKAFSNLMQRVPSQKLKSFISIMMHNKEQGGSVYDSLNQISLTLYQDKMAKLTEQGQKIPGRLTAILTICGIPIVLIIVIGPYLPKLMTIFEKGTLS